MRKPIQLNRTIKIDEYEASIFYDGSIIVNTAESFRCFSKTERQFQLQTVQFLPHDIQTAMVELYEGT